MGRYIPTPEEQAAIDLLTSTGHVILRRRSYDRLRERLRIAQCQVDMEREMRSSTERWARDNLTEERRLHNRLNEVCRAAAGLGVPIQTINEALAGGKS